MRKLMTLASLAVAVSCNGTMTSPSAPSEAGGGIGSDAAFFSLVTQAQPFASYPLFPNLDANAAGVLNGTGPHVPNVRVRMNAAALAALQNGRLPAGSRFPDGAVIFKEVLTSGGQVSLYSVMYKDRQNPLAGEGWLWAEYRPDGSPAISVADRGRACVGCHSLSEGPRNDFVRIFERQR